MTKDDFLKVCGRLYDLAMNSELEEEQQEETVAASEGNGFDFDPSRPEDAIYVEGLLKKEGINLHFSTNKSKALIRGEMKGSSTINHRLNRIRSNRIVNEAVERGILNIEGATRVLHLEDEDKRKVQKYLAYQFPSKG